MAGPVALPRPGDVVGGKYVLDAMLGESSVGAVFRAHHASTGHRFAIRCLTPSAAPHLSKAGAHGELSNFHHPLVLSPVDVGRAATLNYIVMEWLDGETLASRLESSGTLALSEVAQLLTPCMRAIHEMHLAQLMHRDLRPSNIFVCRSLDNRPELARLFHFSVLDEVTATQRIGADRPYSADAHYRAPEQLTRSPVDHRADIYAFGALIYTCVTGNPPFFPDRSDDYARWIYAQDPPALPGAAGLTPALYRFLARAMARDACNRIDTCSDLANALEEVLRRPVPVGVSVQHTKFVRSSVPTIRLAALDPVSLQPTAAIERDSLPPRALQPRPPDFSEPSPPQPRTAAASGMDATRAPLHIGGSDAPVELRAPLVYRKPIDMRVVLAGICFTVFGIIPTWAYYAPPLLPEESVGAYGSTGLVAPAVDYAASDEVSPLAQRQIAAALVRLSSAAPIVDPDSVIEAPLDAGDPAASRSGAGAGVERPLGSENDAEEESAHSPTQKSHAPPKAEAGPRIRARRRAPSVRSERRSAPVKEPAYRPSQTSGALWERPAARPKPSAATEKR